MATTEAEQQPDAPSDSPFDGMDYDPDGRRPSIVSVTAAALDIAKLYGVSGRHSLAAAILLDQGWATEALALLDGARLEALQAIADKKKAGQK